MLDKCAKIGNCVCFLIIISGVLFGLIYLLENLNSSPSRSVPEFKFATRTVTFLDMEVHCHFRDMLDYTPLKIPSMESFIPTSTTEEGQELRLSGLAVFSNLTSTCQPLADVSKAKIQINKIALISLANETECPFKDLLVHAQNAGYSVVIFTNDSCPQPRFNTNKTELQDKLLIPVLCVYPDNCDPTNYLYEKRTGQPETKIVSDPSAADRTKIEIKIKIDQKNTILKQIQEYLRRLYYWFLLGPLITLEWLRRKKKLCCKSGGQLAEEGRAPEETTVESALNTAEYEETRGETQPLLIVLNESSTTSVTRSGHTRLATVRRVLTYLGKMFGNLAVGFCYVFLIVVALPVGISSGGWSFFRFDEDEILQESFLAPCDPEAILSLVFSFCWSPVQTFCFFLYSRFVCKTTWTVPTNFSKLIRSDWFSSNVYLLTLGVVVPLSSSGDSSALSDFAIYNMVCTTCNVLFVLILNKHKFVTLYVFYTSVCMICAYIESDNVALFYFVMNSKGSLTNLKLTALRTVAISLTLSLSFSTSMHIIRKLTKPRESLLEGLGEK